MSITEKWGYGFWLFMGLVFGIPEGWAGLASPPWPALSDTIAHLDAPGSRGRADRAGDLADPPGPATLA